MDGSWECFAGRRGLLARKAAKLFVHVKDIIAQTSLASPIGQEYSALLRAHLLPVPQYCNVVSSITFQGDVLLSLSMHLQPHQQSQQFMLGACRAVKHNSPCLTIDI